MEETREWAEVQKLAKSLRLKYKHPFYYQMLYVAAKYTSVLLLNPFELAMILLQTQFIPKVQNEDPTETDSFGYLINKGEACDYQLPNIQNTSIPKTLFMCMKMKHEGFLSIWKGHTVFFARELTASVIEPLINNLITDSTFIQRDFALVHSSNLNARFTILMTSHFITGMLLSPLELIQTRLVVQSRKRGVQKYSSAIHCLTTVISEEYDGGFDIYKGKLLLPNALYHLLNPIFRNITPLMVDKLYGYYNESIMHVFIELGVSIIELIVMLPIETVRRRMMTQVIRRKPIEREFTTVVDIDPIPYTSITDCLYRLVVLENKTKYKWSIRGLYRGFKVRLTTNIVVAILQLLTHVVDTTEQ